MQWSSSLRVALRALRRRPGFAATVVFCLSAGLAVSVGAAGVAKQVLVDPLPFADAGELRVLYRAEQAGETGEVGGVTYGAFGDIQAAGVFDGAAVVHLPTFDQAIVLTGGDRRERVVGLRVSPGFFSVLGVAPFAGRTFDTGPTVGAEAMVTHAGWQTRFGGAPVTGTTIAVGGEPVTIVGVLPPGFRYEASPDAELFLATRPTAGLASDREARIFQVVVRTALTGPSLDAALGRVDAGIRQAAPRADLATLRAAPIREFFFGDVRRPLLFLAAAGALTLLVAVVNITLLILARGQERAAGDSLRLALGAGRRRLMAGPLAEALPLGLVAAVLGVLGAKALVSILADLATNELPVHDLAVDPLLALAALALALGATGAAAVAAAQGTRTVELGALRDRGRGLDRRGLRRWNLLIGAQTALVAFLLVSAGLTGRSLMKLLNVDPGFDPAAAWAVQFELPAERYSDPGRLGAFVRQAETALQGRPGIAAAGMVSNLPLTPGWSGLVQFRDRSTGDQTRPSVGWEIASPGYFDAMGIPLRQGRAFTHTDNAGAPRVAVINETMARRFWPTGDVLGSMISASGRPDDWAEVVGVVGDVRKESLAREAGPTMYIPHGQLVAYSAGQVVVRAAPGAEASAASAARATLVELEPLTVVGSVRELEALIRSDTASNRLQGALLALFAATALILGLAGVFGVVSYAVGRRTRELGIRMALGATPGAVARRVLAGGLAPVLAGVVAGVAGAYLAGAAFQHLLFQTSPSDPLVFLGLPPILLATAAAALLIPAMRAARTDPARILTDE